MDQLTNPFLYYEQDSDDNGYTYTRRVIPKPDTGYWQEVTPVQYKPAMSDVSDPDDDFSSSHKVVERPASPTQLTATFTASHTVQFTPHPHPIPSILEWRQSPAQQPQQDQKEGPMWDPACLASLASLACEETKRVYHLSTPPTPLPF